MASDQPLGPDKITGELAERVLGAFRERPGDFKFVRQRLPIDVSLSLIEACWERGVVGVEKSRPFRVVIQDEQNAARARVLALQDQQDITLALAKQQAVEAHVEEGKLVKVARQGAIGLMSAVGMVNRQARDVAEKIKAAEIEALPVEKRMRVLRDLAALNESAAHVARAVMEMERLHLGEPTNVIGVKDVGQTTIEQALRDAQEAATAFARARELGYIDVEGVPVGAPPAAIAPLNEGETWEGDPVEPNGDEDAEEPAVPDPSTTRIVMAGVPRAGKTTAANEDGQIAGIPVRHTDDLIDKADWSEASRIVAEEWFAEPGPWIIEGVAAVRALRKWLAAHKAGRPCDEVYWFERPHVPLTPGQETMRKGCETVWAEVRPLLEARGVEIHDGPPEDAEPPAAVPPEDDADESLPGID